MATPKKSKAKLHKNNTVGYVGVSALKDGKFIGRIVYGGRSYRTEKFGTAEKAARAYDEMAKKAIEEGHVKRATLNFPS